MMGTKERNFQPLPENISLEDLVPEDNFCRRLQEKLDLSFVRELVEDRYAASGRPSVDPEVFFRLQLVMFYEGIRSERELMRIASDRLSVRWYVGYDLHEPLPDHSSLTRIRDRFGLPVFREFFERIVELCVEAGLVWGEELYFDATKVDASASLDSIAPRFYVEEHLGEVFTVEEPPNAEQEDNVRTAPPSEGSRRWPSFTNFPLLATTHSPRRMPRKTTGSPETDARDASERAYGTGARRTFWRVAPTPTPLR